MFVIRTEIRTVQRIALFFSSSNLLIYEGGKVSDTHAFGGLLACAIQAGKGNGDIPFPNFLHKLVLRKMRKIILPNPLNRYDWRGAVFLN